MPSFSERQTFWVLVIILLMYPLIGMVIDLISPSLPAITNAFQTTSAYAKNLVSLYFLGYAFANIFAGFLTDAWGRRRLAIIGCFAFTVMSLLPTLFHNLFLLLMVRFLQGVSVGVFAIVGRAVISDVAPQEKLLRISTLIATMWGIGPIIGPAIGGYLQFHFGWQACFYFFAAYGLMLCILFFFLLPETLVERQSLHWERIKNNSKTVLTSRLFIGVIILMGLAYSILVVFNTLAPFFVQVRLHYSPLFFGRMALIMGISFLAGTFFCRRLLKQHTPESVLKWTVVVSLIVSLLGLLVSLLDDHNVWVLCLFSFILFFGVGIIYPTGIGKGMSMFRHVAGVGSAVMNMAVMLCTGMAAFLTGFLTSTSSILIQASYVVLMLLSLLVFWKCVRE